MLGEACEFVVEDLTHLAPARLGRGVAWRFGGGAVRVPGGAGRRGVGLAGQAQRDAVEPATQGAPRANGAGQLASGSVL